MPPKPRRGSGIRMRVHERGNPRLDGILRVVDLAGRAKPLPELLAELCAEIAAIMQVEVVSVYVREPDPDADSDVLVMRGNVGFPASALGNVRLHLGEGITGFVAECQRPVSCAVGQQDPSWKPVQGLGEERFPAFLALPVVQAGQSTGVLVLQRRVAKELTAHDLALAAALTAPVGYALERAHARRDAQAGGPAGSRAARLVGSALAPGEALGRVETVPPLAGKDGEDEKTMSAGPAFDAMARELARGSARVLPSLPADARRHLAVLALLWDDQRLRETALEECNNAGLAPGLRRVVREYARAPYRAGVSPAEGGDWMTERAAEIEDLCVLVAAYARGLRPPAAGGVLVAERLTACLALAAAARGAAGVVLAGPVDDGALGAAILRAAEVPAVCAVGELFTWARPGDRVLVEGGKGVVRINPPASAEAKVRAARGPRPTTPPG